MMTAAADQKVQGSKGTTRYYSSYTAATAAFYAAFGVTLCIVETRIISCILGTFMLLAAALTLNGLRYFNNALVKHVAYWGLTWRILVGLLGASLLSYWGAYTNHKSLKSALAPIGFAAGLLLIRIQMQWCNKLKQNELDTLASANQDFSLNFSFKVSKLALDILLPIMLSLNISRIPHGLVFCRYFSEGIIGVFFCVGYWFQLKSGLEFSWSKYLPLFNLVASVVWVIGSAAYYASFPNGREAHFQYGFSMIITWINCLLCYIQQFVFCRYHGAQVFFWKSSQSMDSGKLEPKYLMNSISKDPTMA